jgi:hypothetical protein
MSSYRKKGWLVFDADEFLSVHGNKMLTNKSKVYEVLRRMRLPDPMEMPSHKFMAAFQEEMNGRAWKGMGKGTRGKVFESGISIALISRGIRFEREKTFKIRCLKIDFVIPVKPCSEHRHEWLCLSTKTSCRERWRQFHYEADLLKRVRGSEPIRFIAIRGGMLVSPTTQKLEKEPETNMPAVDAFFSADCEQLDRELGNIRQ